MDHNMIDNLSNKIDEICTLLNVLIRLSLPPPNPDSLGLKGEQRDVYLLCDSTRTIEEITEMIGKPRNQVTKSLNRLKEKGLVDSVIKRKNVFYFRIPVLSMTGTKDDV